MKALRGRHRRSASKLASTGNRHLGPGAAVSCGSPPPSPVDLAHQRRRDRVAEIAEGVEEGHHQREADQLAAVALEPGAPGGGKHAQTFRKCSR